MCLACLRKSKAKVAKVRELMVANDSGEEVRSCGTLLNMISTLEFTPSGTKKSLRSSN